MSLMPSIGVYSAVAILLVILVVFLFIYTNRRLRGYGADDAGTDAGIEGFATLSAATTANKTLWRERLPDLVAFVLFQGFITTDVAEENVISIFHPTDGRRALKDLWTYMLDADSAEYYTNQLWTDFVDWESKFPYETKPLTYLELKQFAKTHRLFTDANWEQTMTKTFANDDFRSLTYYYNLMVQMERMLTQAVATNPLAMEAVAKRGRYLVCALDTSTTFETFQQALIALGFRAPYTIYTNNRYMYDRLKAIKDTYREPILGTRIKHFGFLYYQWEIVLAAAGTGDLSRMTSVLNGLPANCAGLSVAPNQPPSAGATGTSGTTGTSGATGTSGTTGGSSATSGNNSLTARNGVYAPIPSPPMKTVPVPNIKVPNITPAVPLDAVPFTPMDTSSDRTRFFWFSIVFFLIVFILWDIVFYMLFSGSGSGAAAPATNAVVSPLPAPAPVAAPVAAPVRKESYYDEDIYDARRES